MTTPTEHASTVDVVVVGSGAAGLAAAVSAAHAGRAVSWFSRRRRWCATAFSGGMAWIPLNHHLAEVGVTHTREESLRYLGGLTQGREPDPALLATFVDAAAAAVAFLEEATRCGSPRRARSATTTRTGPAAHARAARWTSSRSRPATRSASGTSVSGAARSSPR